MTGSVSESSTVGSDLLQILPAADDGPPNAPIAGVFSNLGEPVWAAIRASPFRNIALQVPAGLLRGAAELAAEVVRATGARVTLVNRACFGACDVPLRDEVPGVEAVLALGHSPIPNVRVPLPTFFVEMRSPPQDPEPLAELLEASSIPRRLGLLASVQHLDLLPPLRAALGRRGFELPVATGDRRLAYPAQALGCNYSSSEAISRLVDGFLFLGTGRFHPLGLALATAKPVWALDPLQRILEPPIERDELLARRLLYVAQARDAKRWGILISSFPGQHRPAMAEALRRRAEAAGREAVPIVFTRLDARDLEGRDLDAYVNTACPRIATDDSALYERPILTPPEFLMAIGALPLTEYKFDTFR
jgi:2-(3-amino-3-carboxypropyl)histidine synthase